MGTVSEILHPFFMTHMIFRPVETELWNFDDGNFIKTMPPTLINGQYKYGFALFPVDTDYCR